VRRVKQFAITYGMFAVIAGPALAADLPLKSRPLPSAPQVHNWTGFYVGLHAGGGWHDGSDATFQRFTGGGDNPQDLQAGSLDGRAFALGGAQAGYNWQFANFVLGVEADISASGGGGGSSVFLTEGPVDVNVSAGTRDWFGTLRARAGYLVYPSLLAYVTGGLAFGDRASVAFNVTRRPAGGPFTLYVDNGDDIGWVVGGGLEYKLDNRWSAKFEYQYLNFDGDGSTTVFRFNAGQTGHFSTSGDNALHTMRVGLNYSLMGWR
jgi:outer membrane immunogenic protein